jgi:hypothetical protein
MSMSMMNSSSDNPQDAALAYLSRGWSVIPMRTRSKRPIVAWHGYQQQRPDVGDVKHWYARWPDANVGIVTGRLSGLVVVDVDSRHDGEETLDSLIRQHGPLPDTVEARSGGGGRHLYFAHPGGHMPNRVEVFRGIDLRADGGVIVAPPSVHPSGERYRWARGRSPDALELAPMPRWLLDAVTPRRQGTGHPVSFWRDLMAEGVGEGRRNNAIASISGHLLWHGVDEQVLIELLLAWNRVRCQPPLSDEEVVRTVESIARTHHRQEAGGDELA